MKDSDEATDPLSNVNIVPNKTKELLNERQFLDYRSEREQSLDWLLDTLTTSMAAPKAVSSRISPSDMAVDYDCDAVANAM